jgi:hypothetical protein
MAILHEGVSAYDNPDDSDDDDNDLQELLERLYPQFNWYTEQGNSYELTVCTEDSPLVDIEISDAYGHMGDTYGIPQWLDMDEARYRLRITPEATTLMNDVNCLLILEGEDIVDMMTTALGQLHAKAVALAQVAEGRNCDEVWSVTHWDT